MSKIIPFPALLPRADLVDRIMAPPYDIVDTTEARRIAADNPHSFLHLTRPEIDLDHEVNAYDDDVYRTARANRERFEREGWLVRDEPALYAYRATRGGHTQTGFVCGASVAEYENGAIKRHEKTRMQAEDERTQLALSVRAHLEPVLYAHKRNDAIATILEEATRAAPLFDCTCPAGIRHQLWRVPRPDELVAAAAELAALYIADGHHRSAAAARVFRTLREEDPETADEAAFFPAVVFPDDELRVYRYDWEGPAEERPLADVTMADIMAVADRNEVMPPKSTWFAPKLASGFFVYTF